MREFKIMSHKTVLRGQLVILDTQLVKDSTLQPQDIGLQICQIQFALVEQYVFIWKQLVKEYIKTSNKPKTINFL